MRTWEPTDANIYDVDADIEESTYRYVVIAMASGAYIDSFTLPTIDVVIDQIDSMTGKNEVMNVHGSSLHSANAYLFNSRQCLSQGIRLANWSLCITRGIKNG